MYHANGHHVNRNCFNEKRTTMQERALNERERRPNMRDAMPETAIKPANIANDPFHSMTRDDDDLLFWG